MSGIEWLVVIGGAVAIVWVNWFFLFAERGADARRESRASNESRDTRESAAPAAPRRTQ